jgi:hypothetical protein
MRETIAPMQSLRKLGSERLLMLADKIISQVIDGKILEKQALGQGSEIRFQSFDDL